MVIIPGPERTVTVPAPLRTALFVRGGITAPQYFKAAVDKAAYSVDWSPLNRTIAASYWVLPSGATDAPSNEDLPLSDTITPDYGIDPTPKFFLGGTALDGPVASVKVSGGTSGKGYWLQNVIATDETPPSIYSQKIWVTVED